VDVCQYSTLRKGSVATAMAGARRSLGKREGLRGGWAAGPRFMTLKKGGMGNRDQCRKGMGKDKVRNRVRFGSGNEDISPGAGQRLLEDGGCWETGRKKARERKKSTRKREVEEKGGKRDVDKLSRDVPLRWKKGRNKQRRFRDETKKEFRQKRSASQNEQLGWRNVGGRYPIVLFDPTGRIVDGIENQREIPSR